VFALAAIGLTMSFELPGILAPTTADLALQAFLLGSVEFEAALALQRRLVYNVAGDRGNACLVLCAHPPLITVGRQGSHGHIRFDPEELFVRGWPVRWVNRGGGCLLHLPGQLAIYPILPLDRLELGLEDYLHRLEEVVAAVLDDFSIRCQTRRGQPGLWVNGRLIAHFGVAVRDWVSYFGCYLNIDPDLEPYRRISCGGAGEPAMTSLARERHGPLRTALVRERLVEYFADRFHLARTSVFFAHPSLGTKASTDAVAARY
jgi:lipoyl(octanoyl) transferase